MICKKKNNYKIYLTPMLENSEPFLYQRVFCEPQNKCKQSLLSEHYLSVIFNVTAQWRILLEYVYRGKKSNANNLLAPASFFDQALTPEDLCIPCILLTEYTAFIPDICTTSVSKRFLIQSS